MFVSETHRTNVRLLPARTSTMTTELLRLCSSRVGDEKRTVVRNKLLLQLKRARGVEVLGVVRNDRLCNRLAESVDLRSVSTTLHTEPDVDRRESFFASDQDGLVDLETQDLGLE